VESTPARKPEIGVNWRFERRFAFTVRGAPVSWRSGTVKCGWMAWQCVAGSVLQEQVEGWRGRLRLEATVWEAVTWRAGRAAERIGQRDWVLPYRNVGLGGGKKTYGRGETRAGLSSIGRSGQNLLN